MAQATECKDEGAPSIGWLAHITRIAAKKKIHCQWFVSYVYESIYKFEIEERGSIFYGAQPSNQSNGSG